MKSLPRAVLLTLGTVALSGLFVSALNNEPLFNTAIPSWGAATAAGRAGRAALVAAYLGLVVFTARSIQNGLPIWSPGKRAVEPRRVLVIPASTPDRGGTSVSWEDDGQVRIRDRNGVESSFAPGDLGGACRSSLEFNWQQVLRAVAANERHVEQVELVFSKQGWDEPPGRRPEDLQHLIEHFAGPSVRVHVDARRDLDFGDIDAVYEHLADIVRRLTGEEFDESDITLDATGGLSTTSIATAFASLQSGVRLQYVTNEAEVEQWQHALRDPGA